MFLTIYCSMRKQQHVCVRCLRELSNGSEINVWPPCLVLARHAVRVFCLLPYIHPGTRAPHEHPATCIVTIFVWVCVLRGMEWECVYREKKEKINWTNINQTTEFVSIYHHLMLFPLRVFRSLNRYFSIGVCLLFSVDMFGRAVLYGQHNAFVYNIDRSISLAAISDAIRPK